jgi:zinc protease
VREALAVLVLLSAVAAPFGALRRAEPPAEKEFVLDNGLKVILLERHNIPLVHIVAAVNAGSKDETDATNGLVHLLEHSILFRGTEVRSGSEVARDIRARGGAFNAHTGQDLAVFELTLPSEQAVFGLNNQREILFNLKFDPDEIAAEKEVILEELSQIKDDPFRYASLLLFQNVFRGHPYGRPVIGNAETIRSLTIDEVEAFYRKYFVPANASLAVVGDFRLPDMEAEVRAAFGPVPRTEFVPSHFDAASPPPKAVDVVEELDVQEAYLVIGVPGPDYNSDDQYPGDVLAQVLGRGLNPMIYRPLKGARDLVNTAALSYLTLKHGGIFAAFLTLEPKTLTATRRAAVQFLRQVRNENFSKDDVPGIDQMYATDYLEAARNQLTFDVATAQESGLTLATALAVHLIYRSSDVPFDYLDRIRKVTSSDLRRTAGKYLGRSEYVTVAIVPKRKVP